MFGLLYDFYYNLFTNYTSEYEYAYLENYSYDGTFFGFSNFQLNDYLSLICSLISIFAILLFCIFIIKKIIGIMFRLATGSSAF